MDVVARGGMCLAAAVMLLAVTKAWEPPFPYRVGDVLSEDISLVIPIDGDPLSTANELVHAGEPLTAEMILLLEQDHNHEVSRAPRTNGLVRSLATFGMIFALYAYVAILFTTRIGLLERRAQLLDLARVGHGVGRDGLLGVALSVRTREIVPVLIFGMTCGIAYKRELALLMSTSILIFLGLVCGYGLGEFVVLVGATATAILLLRRIRSRSKLIKVGFFTGLATFGLYLITGAAARAIAGPPAISVSSARRAVGLCRRVLRDGTAAIHRKISSAY